MNSENTTTGRDQMFKWTPSEDLIKTALAAVFAAAGLLGVIGFGESFGSLMNVAYPFLGWASWILPVIIDLGILVLTILSLVLALAGMPSRVLGLVPVALSVWTLYLNTADVPNMVGKAVHGAGPTMWILVVEAGGMALRRLTGLAHHAVRIERIRWVLWLIRPVSTLRLWREMRIHQLSTYRDALDRDASRAAVTGRLRLNHGRRWKRTAPLSERIALTLLGRDPSGVRTSLDAHTETARLLSRTDQDQAEVSADQPATAPLSTAPRTAYVRKVRRMQRIERVRPAPAAKVPAAPAPKSAAPKPRAARVPQVPGAGKVRRSAALSDAQLTAQVERMESEALAASGGTKGTSYRSIQTTLGVGFARAKDTLDRVRQAPAAVVIAPAPAVVEHVNGSLIAA